MGTYTICFSPQLLKHGEGPESKEKTVPFVITTAAGLSPLFPNAATSCPAVSSILHALLRARER